MNLLPERGLLMQQIACLQCGYTAKLPEGYYHPTVQCPKCKKVYQLADLVLGVDTSPVARKPVVSPVVRRAVPADAFNEALAFDGGDDPLAEVSEAEDRANAAVRLRKRLSDSCRNLGNWVIASGVFCVGFTAGVFTLILTDDTKLRSYDEEADMMLGKMLRGFVGLLTAAFGSRLVWLGLRLIKEDGYKTSPRTLREIGTFDAILLLVGIFGSFFNRVAKLTQPVRVGDPLPDRPIDGMIFTALFFAFMLAWAGVSLFTWQKSESVAGLSTQFRRAERAMRPKPKPARQNTARRRT